MGRDFNVATADADVWDPAARHGGTQVSPREREAFVEDLDEPGRRRPPGCIARQVQWT